MYYASGVVSDALSCEMMHLICPPLLLLHSRGTIRNVHLLSDGFVLWMWTSSLGKQHPLLLCLAIVQKTYFLISLQRFILLPPWMLSPSTWSYYLPSAWLEIPLLCFHFCKWAFPLTSEHVQHRIEDVQSRQEKPLNRNGACLSLSWLQCGKWFLLVSHHWQGQKDLPFLPEERLCAEGKSPSFCF